MKQAPSLRRKALLVIMDGFGINPSKKNNAVYEANTPNLDNYFSQYPHTTLDASGLAVGLPNGQMGNSEVGHLTIGCGSIIKKYLIGINDAIADGSFKKNIALLAAIDSAKQSERPLHLLGLVSDGGVHSHIKHLFALVEMCHEMGVKPVVHVITDGRDTSPKVIKHDMQLLLDVLEKNGGTVSTVAGRYYSMDRDNRWDRTKKSWDAMVNGEGLAAMDPMQAIEDAYANGETDEFIQPRIMSDADLIETGDTLIFFNFRNDRPRQIASALTLGSDFQAFDRGDYQPINITTMAEYDKSFELPVAFEADVPDTNIAEVLSNAGLKQLHCAETEKYAHVTFFMNGGREAPYENEERVMIESPKVGTYDECPEMSAKAVADVVVGNLEQQEQDFIVVNFANCDMVGHTAIPDAVIQAVEAVDEQVGRVLDAAIANDYSVVLTADHGNCDEYIDPYTGEPHTQHTLYPVPCLVIDKSFWSLGTGGGLSNIAPTLLQLMGLPQPKGMDKPSLLLEELR